MRINIGETYSNKRNETFKINAFLYKEKNNDWYDVTFLETGNKQGVTKNQIKNGTAYDVVQRKKLKRIQTELKLRERNRLIKKAREQFYFPDSFKNKKLLSIDLASGSTGLAFSNEGHIIRWKTITFDDKDFRKRSYKMAEFIHRIIPKVDAVIIEDTYLGLNSSVLSKLSELRGMVTYKILEMEKALFLVPPVLWKNQFEGVPVHRNEQKEFMKAKFFEYTGVSADSDDCADAYMILKACLNWKA